MSQASSSGAPVQVEGEAAGHVDRLPDYQHQDVEQVRQVLQPEPLAGFRVEQALPVPVDLVLRRDQQVEKHGEAGPERHFQVHADHGQPGRAAGVALGQYDQALAAGLPGEPFQLQDRQVEAARRTEAAPQQAGRQLLPQQGGIGAQGLPQGWRIAEQGVRENVQRQPFEGRLEPPEDQDRQGRMLPQQEAEHGEQRQGQQRPTAHQQARMAMRQEDAEVERFPGAARADRHAGVSQAHGGSVRRTGSSCRPAARGPRRPRTSPAARND